MMGGIVQWKVYGDIHKGRDRISRWSDFAEIGLLKPSDKNGCRRHPATVKTFATIPRNFPISREPPIGLTRLTITHTREIVRVGNIFEEISIRFAKIWPRCSYSQVDWYECDIVWSYLIGF